MTNIINKLLARFGFQLVYIKQKPDLSLVEASVKFLNENPKFVSDPVKPNNFYLGDINYLKEIVDDEFPQVSGETYYKSQHSQYEKYFCDYNADEKTLSKEDFKKIYDETTFTTEQLKNKLE
jgi:hypothetical protein